MTFYIAFRSAMLLAALFNIAWTSPAAFAAARGRWTPLSWFKLSLFFMALGAGTFSAFVVFGHPNDATRTASSFVVFIGLVLAIVCRGQMEHLEKFKRLFVFLDGALAIVDLWLVDHDAARVKADECRQLIAKALARG